MEPLFISRGPGIFEPTSLTVGPWFPDAQHGGPPAALLMRAVESAEAPGPMQIARFTIELLRAVPVAVLEVAVRVLRPGRKVQLVEAAILHQGEEVAIARAWQIAHVPGTTPPSSLDEPAPPAPPAPRDTGFVHAMAESWGEGFHTLAVEKQVLTGSFGTDGPGSAWMRLVPPVVDDERASPWQRVAAIADFGNGLSSALDPEEYLFINTDLTIGFGRVPVGQWTLLDAVTVAGPDGMGMATGRLGDIHGTFGRSIQSLLIAGRT